MTNSKNIDGEKLELGFTKISDLLVENKITKLYSRSDNSDQVHLRIPDYQRPYKWTNKNVYQLLDDIEDAITQNKENFRIGTIILNKINKKVAEYDIVDGQQRLLTFSLLLYYFGKKQINIEITDTQGNNEYTKFNLKNNLLAINRRISKYSDDIKNKFLDYLTNNCELIVVITNNQDTAFQFFDSQNSRGKELFPHDLLKAFHLREMNNLDEKVIENVVKEWEELDQNKLADLFNEYLYRLKEWLRGKDCKGLNKDNNIALFKGIKARDCYPYTQFYKAAYVYINEMNSSSFCFVSGSRKTRPFLLTEPVIAGKAFFEYTQHYFSILNDIQDNDKYRGYFVNDNKIVRTLDTYYNYGSGNLIVRKLFDLALLLYVDRFCPQNPSVEHIELFDQFIVYAFIWAYSLRAQYKAIRWSYAENYILEKTINSNKKIVNNFNIYREISSSSSPKELLNSLSDLLKPVPTENNNYQFTSFKNVIKPIDSCSLLEDEKEVTKYLDYFHEYHYLKTQEGNHNE